ncbi:MAG: hypothetical protein ABI380_16180 [Edaphobacter sp.]
MTEVGVAPEGFFGDRMSSTPPDFYLPIATMPDEAGGKIQEKLNITFAEAERQVNKTYQPSVNSDFR